MTSSNNAQGSSRTVSIIGQGYVGLPLAMAAVAAGFEVVAIEKSAERVTQLNIGASPVEDVSNKALADAIASGRYSVTSDYAALANSPVVVICVPTPLNGKREPDLALLESAVKSIAPYLADETLIVNESTSYPGTLRDVIVPIVQSGKSESVKKLYFASAPERVNPADAKWNMKNTPRLVGGIDAKSQELALNFYSAICDEVVATSSPEVAEAAKLLENTFRMVNISLVLELAQVFNKAGLDINEVIDAAATKPYGYMPFRPSVGIGGHCIPVDPLYLTWWANQQGAPSALVEKADQISRLMPKYIAERAMALIGDAVVNPKILVLGVAYKPGVSDTRETPVNDLVSELQKLGAVVACHDPLLSKYDGAQLVDATWPCDLAILATNQPGIDFSQLLASKTTILDCTNSLKGFAGVVAL
jgi:UDP-N-acetyl-D-glucosamine dehydrogenase